MRRSHAVLATVGLAALITYIMACRPAFSPDGSKILFPYVDTESRRCAIGLFDRSDGTSRCLLSAFSPRGGDTPTLVTAQWTADGRSALVFLPEERGKDHLRILLLPLDRGKPVRTYFIPSLTSATAAVMIPPPVMGRHVFVGGKPLVRLDLKTGGIERAGFDTEIVPIQQGSRLYYVGETTRPGVDYDFGTLDPETLAPKPILELRKKDTGDVTPFIAVSADGTRIAMVVRHEKRCRILIFEHKKLERSLSLDAKSGARMIGNIELAADAQTVYASYLREIASDSSFELGILEASVAGDAMREIPLLRTPLQIVDLDNDLPQFIFQIALSPDGATLAATSGLFHVLSRERALYLVDLKYPGRKVTRMPIPEPETKPDRPEKK